jgi:tRNA(fMet)-specific endonuclease VapC
VLCDTTVAAALFVQDARLRPMAQLESRTRAISVITLGEMRRGALAASWGERRRAALEAHLRSFLVLAIDAEIADEWASLAARCTELGRSKRASDLWIAATARHHRLALASLDLDYSDMPGVTLIGPDGSELPIPF